MGDNQDGWETVDLGQHISNISGRRIIVPATGNHDEEELRAITKEWAEYRATQRQRQYKNKLFSGVFRWCLNYPQCRNAFLARLDKIKEGKAWYCSGSCTIKTLEIQADPLQFQARLLSLSETELILWLINESQRRKRDPGFASQLNILLETEVGPKIREAFFRIKGTAVAKRNVINSLGASAEGKEILLGLRLW